MKNSSFERQLRKVNMSQPNQGWVGVPKIGLAYRPSDQSNLITNLLSVIQFKVMIVSISLIFLFT